MSAARSNLADTVIFCDGYDSVCLDSLASMTTKFASLGHAIIFSHEPQDQPEFWLGLNCGLVMADRTALLGAFDERTLDEFIPNHFIDQNQVQSWYSWNSGAFKLDQQGVLFHTLGLRSVELVERGNKLINPVTGFAPSFVHAPHEWEMSRIEQWISALN